MLSFFPGIVINIYFITVKNAMSRSYKIDKHIFNFAIAVIEIIIS